MDLGLSGKRALVVAASSGLGLAAAEALAREGVSVTINSRDRARLEAAAAQIHERTGHQPALAPGDICVPETVTGIVKTAGDVDILVSNTGGPPAGPFSDHPPERWQQAAQLILYSAINLTRQVIESMKTRGWGRVIYMTSVAVLQPIDDLILSNTFRAGLTAFCKTMSNTHASYGITFNTVCPGYTATERLWELAESRAAQQGTTPEQIMEAFGSNTPAGRVGRPEELAALITFLAGEPAGYITGTSIPVDGGLVKALI